MTWIAHYQRIRQFRQRTDGVAALEFAILTPFLIVLLFGSVEVADALLANRRVTMMANAVSDLVAQSPAPVISDDALNDVFDASELILAPYDTGPLQVTVFSVVMEEEGDPPVVIWSETRGGTAPAEGTEFAAPEGILAEGQSVIVAQVSYQFEPGLGKILTSEINLSKTSYARPRRFPTIFRE